MKRIHPLLAAAALALAAAASFAAGAPPKLRENPFRRSPYVGALSIDAQTGRTLFADRANTPAYPASVTKLMTAYLVLDDIADGKIRLDDVVAASPVRTREDKHLRQPSCTGLAAGGKMTVNELLTSLLVFSANDAAIFLAEKCSGSTGAFVERMNAKARELGMASTVYYNPNGLPPPPGAKMRKFNVSTCRDLARLACSLIERHPEVLKYTSIKVWDMTAAGRPVRDMKGGQIKKRNHNNVMVKDALKIVNPDKSEAVDGLKTGFIEMGGSSIILTGVRKGRRAIVIVLGSATAAERDERARFLLEDALDSFSL